MKAFFLKFSVLLIIAITLLPTSSFAIDLHASNYLRELSGAQDVNQKWLKENTKLMEEFFNGRYTFESKEKENVLYFPSTNRNPTDVGYQNYQVPPQPWYAKIPMKSEFTFRFENGQLVVRHTSLFGAYVPDQIGEVIESKVTLSSMSSSEKVTFLPSSRELKFKMKRGVPVVGGCKIEINVKKLANGDIILTDYYKGWALLPSPAPITVIKNYIIKKIK
ncbi:MAG: hypothetical protein HQM10_25350 [Candidatus Riflebacteria bacterium]|nr:hypothetical protein [Candidatus Riflebacteria bacterium]